jgi:hypothetical protein
VTDLNREMQELEADMAEADARVLGLRAAPPELKLEELGSSSGLTATALDNMREELYRL